MADLQKFVVKSLRSWSEDIHETLPKQIVNIRVKPYNSGWEKRLKKQLCLYETDTVPKTYSEILKVLKGMNKYVENLFFIVINTANGMTIVAVVSSCLNLRDFEAGKDIAPYFIEIGDKSSNHEIKNFGKAVSKRFWKHTGKTSFRFAKEIQYNHFAFGKKYV